LTKFFLFKYLGGYELEAHTSFGILCLKTKKKPVIASKNLPSVLKKSSSSKKLLCVSKF
jgi:hypothetical protein